MIDNREVHNPIYFKKVMDDNFTIPFCISEPIIEAEARTYAMKIMHKKIKTDKSLSGLKETEEITRDIFIKVFEKIHRKIAAKYNDGKDIFSRFSPNFNGVHIPLMSEYITIAAMSPRGLEIVNQINKADGFKHYSRYRTRCSDALEVCRIGDKYTSAIYTEQSNDALIYKAFDEVVTDIYQELFPDFSNASLKERHKEKAGYYPVGIRFYPDGQSEDRLFFDEDGVLKYGLA